VLNVQLRTDACCTFNGHTESYGSRLVKTQSAKAKGRKLQQWTAEQILQTYPHLENDDVRSTSMGVSGSDVQLSPLARKSFSYDVECKSLARVGVYRYVDQCNNRSDTQPLVIVKENRRKPLAVVDAEHFFELLRNQK